MSMNRLGINSLGELVQRSADELSESRNFGPVALNEVRQKLAERGLSLRGEDVAEALALVSHFR